MGNAFTHAQLAARGAIVIATAPSLAQGDAQKAWDAAFRGATRPAAGPAIVMLEDMSQSWFRGVVLSKMRESYHPGGMLLLLLDEGGAVRKALGVAENATVAFAFTPGGTLAAVETGKATVERAQRLLSAASARP